MTDSKRPAFDPHAFLLNAGLGKKLVHLKAKQAFFVQGDPASVLIIKIWRSLMRQSYLFVLVGVAMVWDLTEK